VSDQGYFGSSSPRSLRDMTNPMQPQRTPVEGGAARRIGAVAGAWSDAWNAHDMDAAARLVAPDVDFVTVAGQWLKGVDEFLAHHRQIHRAHMSGSRWANLACAIQELHETLYLVHLEWVIVGDRDPAGTPRTAPRCGIFTWLILDHGGEWRIRAAHNTDLCSDVRRRLACGEVSVTGAIVTRGQR
jgi:uncharacterized protein (TIGR02246 family)